jgi:hypothetical protein
MYGPRTLAFLLSTTITLVLPLVASAQPAENVRIIRGCGRVRWDVKILADDDSLLVDFRSPISATIEALVDRPALGPDEYTPRQFSERSVFTVAAELYGYRSEPDRTLLLMLRDPETAHTIVASIPDPECDEVAATSRAPLYRALRAWVAAHRRNGDTLLSAVPVRITGVGMYDRLREQPGMAANGFVLMPVIAIEPVIPPTHLAVDVPLAPTSARTPTTGRVMASSTSTKRTNVSRSKRRTRARYRRTRRVGRSTRTRRRRYRGSRRVRRRHTSRAAATRPR